MNDVGALTAVVARPFRGLRPFAYADHELFFGREDQSYALYRLLDRSRFIAVVGSSGSGKSSLVRAGLRPLIEEEAHGAAPPDGTGRAWRWIEFRPADAPLGRLAEALAVLDAGEGEDGPDAEVLHAERRLRILSTLYSSSFGLIEALADGAGRPAVILVDQFEELFRYVAWSRGAELRNPAGAELRDEATRFVQLLLEASRNRECGAHIIITMRSDFIGDCALFYGLPEAVSATQYLVPALTRSERESAIRGPVEKVGAAIDPRLVERLLIDTSDEADHLSVLQHCLSRIWKRAGARARAGTATVTLGLDDYKAIGEIAGALSQHADEVMASLPGLEPVVEAVFRALGQLDDEGRATRRALPLATLLAETGYPEAQLRRVLDRYRDEDCAFLVPGAASVPVLTAESFIDVSHEALLRRWDRIGAKATEVLGNEAPRAGWLVEERNDARIYRALATWAESDGTAATLPLNEVNRRWQWWNERPRTAAWAARYGGQIDRVERLLEHSLDAVKQARTHERRQRVVRMAVASAFAAIVVVAIVVWAKLSIDLHATAQKNADQAEEMTRRARTASNERNMLLTEIGDITNEFSTRLRFIPGVSGIILPILNDFTPFSEEYLAKLKSQSNLTSEDWLPYVRLYYTMGMLDADYQMNVGHTAKAIKKIKDIKKDLRKELPAEAAAMIGDADHDTAKPLLLSETESWVKMASGEMWYGDRDSAKDHLEAAEKSYRAIISDAAAIIDPERAREKLAALYQTRVFFDIQMRGDAAAAAADSAALGEILDEWLQANPPPELGSRQCPVCEFWKKLQRVVPRIQADVAAAEGEGRLDEAIEGYRKLLTPRETTNEAAEAPAQQLERKLEEQRDRSYILYRLALALEKRGSDADLAEASQHLDEAKDTFEAVHHQDPANWWWPLVCQWIDRGRGQTFMKHQKYHDAAMAFADAVARDKELVEFEDSPRAEADLDRDKTALAKAEQAR